MDLHHEKDAIKDGHRFGGFWTKKKLEMLRKYLNAYVIALKKQRFRTVYIDAFAGTGEIFTQDCDDDDECLLYLESDFAHDEVPIAGSARHALETSPAFDEYIFIEKKKDHVEQLKRLCSEYPGCNTTVIMGDANQVLVDVCDKLGTYDRAVLFLDPYGMSVDWTTLQKLAKKKVIDIWFLFNISAISRLIPRSGDPYCNSAVLNRVYGDDSWKVFFVCHDDQLSLFADQEHVQRECSPEKIKEYTLKRMRSIFPAVHPKPKVFYNKRNSPMFLFFFVMTNPSDKAKKVAFSIANGILTS